MIDRAFIPLYLNSDIVNNLFSVVVQEFVEAKSISVRDQMTVNYKGPISEFSRELFGKCIQGELNVQLVNEFSKQKTNATISKSIEIFMELKKILIENKLLKAIEEDDEIDNIECNDYISIRSQIFQNPIVSYIENLINNIEIQNVLGIINTNKVDMINNLKVYMENYKNNNCILHVTNEMCTPKSRFIIPVDYNCNITKFNYTNSCNVSIIGKVIEKSKSNNIWKQEEVLMKLIKNIDFKNQYGSIEEGFNKYCVKNGEIIKILPIAFLL